MFGLNLRNKNRLVKSEKNFIFNRSWMLSGLLSRNINGHMGNLGLNMKRLVYVMAAGILFLAPVNSWADAQKEINQAQQAFKDQDFKKAFDIVSHLAGNGNAEALYLLGALYEEGKGVEKDNAEALKWITLSATLGYVQAEYLIGIRYMIGKDGFEKDIEEAVRWFKKAAEKGYLNAQHSLGMMYYLGQGEPKDLVKAYKWLALAGEKGYRMAEKTKNEIEGTMPPEQIAEARTLAKQWREEHAK
jgi:uncharacterized protein